MSGLLHVHVRGTNRSIDLRDGVRVCAGRLGDCDIQIEDQSVSRHHASLQRRGDEIEVADLESANGTFVNERQVRTGRARAGDLIRLGTTVLEVREGARRCPHGAAAADGRRREHDRVGHQPAHRAVPLRLAVLGPEGRRGAGAPPAGAAAPRDAASRLGAYRDAMPLDEVVDLIKQSAGTHFDPAVADVVVRLHERGGPLPDNWTT